MRDVVNISLPKSMTRVIERAVEEKHFSSKSEFFRMLVRMWEEGKLADELEESRKELRTGKGILLRSLKDLR